MSSDTVLDVRNLCTYFFLRRGTVKAVDGVTFNLGRGEVLGLVGEFGLWQERDCALPHAPAAKGWRAHRRRQGAAGR